MGTHYRRRETDRQSPEDDAVWIYTKDPNVQAFTDLLNRAIDKPSEHVHVSGADDGPIVIHWQTEDEEPKQIQATVIEIEAHHPDAEKNGNG